MRFIAFHLAYVLDRLWDKAASGLSRQWVTIALSAFVALGAAVLLWLQLSPRLPEQISYGGLLVKLLGISALIGLMAFGVTGCSQIAVKSEATRAGIAAPEASATFKAQVVGVQWLNPLVRRDYPTEWQLLWTLGLVKPNKDDELVKEDPTMFTTIQPVAGVAFNMNGKNSLEGFLENYLIFTLKPIGNSYVKSSAYFYTVQPEKTKHWRELHGIHVEFAMPDVPQISKEQGTAKVVEMIGEEFEFFSKKLSTANIPAEVNTTVGGASAGFTSLDKAMDYLEKHPSKSVWVYSWDSPDFPKYKQMSENSTLLVLAGPTFNTEREPLAWIGRPAVQETKAFEPRDGQSRIAQAWQTAIRKAAEQANTEPAKLGYVIHDAGHGSDASGVRLGTLGQALTTTAPELDFMKQTFNTSKLLGDMRAGSAVTNLALAIAWTHQKGQPVLVAGTTEPERATVVVVTPPAKPRLYNPDKNWFRARGEGTTYLPWWGMRKDEKWDSYMQGYSF